MVAEHMYAEVGWGTCGHITLKGKVKVEMTSFG